MQQNQKRVNLRGQQQHTEDWTSHYNVKLEKKDYETNKPLQGANFSLYERFDDRDEVNQENDGNKELYLGIKETENKQWQSGYLSSPVVWDNFRKVLNTVTDNKGIIDKTIEKNIIMKKHFVMVIQPQNLKKFQNQNMKKMKMEIKKKKQVIKMK